MGQSKVVVFNHLFGDATRVAAGGCGPVPGAVEAIARLRASGVKVATDVLASVADLPEMLASDR